MKSIVRHFKDNSSLFYYPTIIFLLNVFIKIFYLNSRDIALDEPFTIYYSQQKITSIVNMLYGENNPPFHFFIMHYWIKLFGIGAFSVRLPSLLFSSISAVFIYKIGNQYFSRLIGVAASVIFSLSTMQIFFSHEARVYPLFVLLTAISLYYYLYILFEKNRKSSYYILFFCNLILIYSHFFGFFILIMEVIGLSCACNPKGYIKSFSIFFILLAICYMPNLYLLFHRFTVSTQNGTWVAPPAVTEYYGNLNRFLNNKYNALVLIIITEILVIRLMIIKQFITTINSIFRNKKLIIVLLWFLVPYTIMFLMSFITPMFIDRYILFTSIPFYIVIAYFIEALSFSNQIGKYALLLFIICQMITVQLNPDNNRRLKEVVEVVNKIKTSDTKTLLAPDYAFMGFAYHYNIGYFKDAPNTMADLNKDLIYPIKTSDDVIKLIRNYSGSCIYIQAGTEFTDPLNLIYKQIASNYKYHKEYPVYQIYIIHQFSNSPISE